MVKLKILSLKHCVGALHIYLIGMLLTLESNLDVEVQLNTVIL